MNSVCQATQTLPGRRYAWSGLQNANQSHHDVSSTILLNFLPLVSAKAGVGVFVSVNEFSIVADFYSDNAIPTHQA